MDTISSPPHKAGFVSIIGKSNVGKSTLMNKLIGDKLSIVSNKVQTTRHKICGMVHEEYFQIIYIDTPGVIVPTYALHRSMMRAVYHAIDGADIVLWVVDVYDQEIPVLLQQAQKQKVPILLLINKIDLITTNQLKNTMDYWTHAIKVTHIIPIVALNGENLDKIVRYILYYLPIHPPYYDDKELLIDRSERFCAQEIIREKILENYHQEIPYSTEIMVESFKDSEKAIKIMVTIYVERNSQKCILIGKKGMAITALKRIAEKELEKFFDKKVYLQQHVKILPNWRKKTKLLERFGYN